MKIITRNCAIACEQDAEDGYHQSSWWAPNATAEGDIDSLAMYGGTGSAFIEEYSLQQKW